MKRRNQKGFTLIELMIVIAIIAILMAYALPAYRDYTIRAKLGEGNAMAAAVKMAVNEAFVRNGDLSVLNAGVNGIPAVGDSVGECVSGMNVTAGVIDITYACTPADPVVTGQLVTWTPTPAGTNLTGLTWTCAYSGGNPGQDPC